MAEYAATYGGLPAPSTPWPLFMALVRRVSRFNARALLRQLDAVSGGIAAAFSEGPQAELHRDEIYRLAYPTKRTTPKMALVQSGEQS